MQSTDMVADVGVETLLLLLLLLLEEERDRRSKRRSGGAGTPCARELIGGEGRRGAVPVWAGLIVGEISANC